MKKSFTIFSNKSHLVLQSNHLIPSSSVVINSNDEEDVVATFFDFDALESTKPFFIIPHNHLVISAQPSTFPIARLFESWLLDAMPAFPAQTFQISLAEMHLVKKAGQRELIEFILFLFSNNILPGFRPGAGTWSELQGF